MAELYVQEKKRSPLIWIVLILIVLALLGWIVWSNYSKTDTTDESTPAPVQQTTPASPTAQ